jgi:hypothetical protein
MRLASKIYAGVLIGAMLAEPAAAVPFQPAPPPTDNAVVQVQHRGHRAGPRPVYRSNRGYRGGYRGGYHRHGGDGGAVAAGAIIGLALGAIIAGQAQQQNAVAWCSQRFRSYDPYSMTYLGYDGRRHRCP